MGSAASIQRSSSRSILKADAANEFFDRRREALPRRALGDLRTWLLQKLILRTMYVLQLLDGAFEMSRRETAISLRNSQCVVAPPGMPRDAIIDPSTNSQTPIPPRRCLRSIKLREIQPTGKERFQK